MKSSNSSRSSNIELLRIIAILGVIILHYNNSDIGGGFKYVEDGSVNYWILLFLEALNICAVNLFILISGYFLCNSSDRKISKIIDLSIKVLVFKSLMYIFYVAISADVFSLKALLTSALFNNYFIILYLVLYVISPYFNVIINSLNSDEYRKLVVLLLMLFSVWPICTDFLMYFRGGSINGISTISNSGNGYGYTIVQFSLMYFVGGYFRQNWKKYKAMSKCKLMIALLVNAAILTVWGYIAEPTAFEYCNPLIILEAVIVFLLFNKINMGNSNIINILASEAFSVFLLHDIMIRQLNIKYFVNSSYLLGHIFISSIAIYAICFMIGKIYSYFVNIILKSFRKVRLNGKDNMAR